MQQWLQHANAVKSAQRVCQNLDLAHGEQQTQQLASTSQSDSRAYMGEAAPSLGQSTHQMIGV